MQPRHAAPASVLLLAGAYALWQRSGHRLPAHTLDLRLEHVVSFGADRGRGNLLGVQPYMMPPDYATPERFRAKLEGYLAAAHAQGWISPRTVVVFPEHLGTWLVALGERSGLYNAATIAHTLRLLALSHLPGLARQWPAAKAADRTAAALFAVKAKQMAEAYHHTFGHLARTLRCTVVAGSILLPSPQIEEGALTVGPAPLQNVAAVYGPDGALHPRLVRKVYLTPAEQPLASGAPSAALPWFETPAGRLGVLICADSWHPEPYARLRQHGVELVAVPSYLEVSDIWHRPWRGYVGMATPPDVDPADAGRITEGQAWLRYALAGRLRSSGARWGLNVFLRGALWDLGADGHTIVVEGDHVHEAPHGDGAALVNLWLGA
ncbi:MAG: hypothetical protein NZ528_12620 [Caldilineales bacterium]|nr:hypothetical protein [Caldilineales bacterium]